MKNSRLYLIGPFDTYETDDVPNAKSELLKLINKTDKWPCDIVIVQSEAGNGSTHLLHAALTEIETQGRHATFVYSEKLLHAHEFYCTAKGRFVHNSRIQVNTEFLLIDGCQYCKANPIYHDFFVGLLRSSIKRGVKIILSARKGSAKQLTKDFPNYHVITSGFPPPIAVYNIINRLFNSNNNYWKEHLTTEETQVRAICAFANQSYKSVRLLENIVLTFLANLHLGKITLQHDNIEDVIDNYVKTFKSKCH